VPIASPPATDSRENRLSLNFQNIHTTILPEALKNKKPTVGFLARFFVEPSIRRKTLPDNNLQTQQTIKT